MSYKKCCVPGCSGTAGSADVLHEFPNPAKDLDRFKKWLACIADGEILKLPNEYVYKNRRVCRKHFEDKFLCRSNRLSNIAVPTININCSTDSEQTQSRQSPNFPTNVPSTSSVVLTCSEAANQRAFRQIQNLTIDVASKGDTFIESEGPLQCNIFGKNKENTKPVSKLIQHHNAVPDTNKKVDQIQQRADSDSAKRRHVKVVTSRVKMTIPERELYQKFVSMKRKLNKYKNKIAKQSTQLKLAKKISSNPAFLKTMEKLPTSAKILTMLQFREQGKKAKGRRFKLNEKITALSILKQSPKAYRFLRKIFILPAPQTLIKLLSRANIKPGINRKIFEQLKAKSAEMKQNEKLCILLFDEMSLKTNVTYNERKDRVSGFVTNGRETQPIFANHAQVYMIRGLQKNYKQPVSYSFSSGATKGVEIAKQLKEIIGSLQQAGLKVVATVCDQGTNNRQAIKYLVDEARGDYLRQGKTPEDHIFKINGDKIVPLYDPPHLLKGIRNNLLTKNLQYEMNGQVKVARWQHIELFHKENPGYKGVRLVPKLTDNHVMPQKMGKMKVKYASQVFSATVASNMGYLADKKILPEECKNTADVLLFFDGLFDSVNGSYNKKKKFAKPLLGPATTTSLHHRVWSEAKPILKSMKFINAAGRKESVPTLNNWVWTLEGIQVLLQLLNNDHNITSVWMRHLNQDPIENFFGSIRSHGCRNTNPTTEQFEAAFTTLLINSLTSVHAPGGNCENDFGEALIALIEEDSNANDDVIIETTIDVEEILGIELEPIETKKCDHKILAPLQYISGYFIKKSKKIFKNCETCKNQLLAAQQTEYIKYREYSDRQWLCSPSDSVVSTVSNMQDVAIAILKNNLEKKNLKSFIKTVIYTLVDLKKIQCPIHKDKFTKYLVNLVSRFFIYTYCKNINKILYGRKDVDDLEDKFQILAKNCFKKSYKAKK